MVGAGVIGVSIGASGGITTQRSCGYGRFGEGLSASRTARTPAAARTAGVEIISLPGRFSSISDIFIVEDEDLLGTSIKRSIRLPGVEKFLTEPDRASMDRQVADYLEKNVPQIVVLDLKTSSTEAGIAHTKLIREIEASREQEKGAVIIGHSGDITTLQSDRSFSMDLTKRWLEAGADIVLAKPNSLSQITKALKAKDLQQLEADPEQNLIRFFGLKT